MQNADHQQSKNTDWDIPCWDIWSKYWVVVIDGSDSDDDCGGSSQYGGTTVCDLDDQRVGRGIPGRGIRLHWCSCVDLIGIH